MKKKVIVKGPALSRSGYGEQTRFALRALREYEDQFDISLINLSWGNTGWIWDDTEERNWIDSLIENYVKNSRSETSYDMSLQVTIPNEFERMANVNVGYTAGVETDKISPQWAQSINNMDRVVVISEFAKKGIVETSYEARNTQTGEVIPDYRVEKPIISVSYPVRNHPSEDLEGVDFETDFNFLAVAQWGIRKNLDNAIKWFLDEFKNDKVGLILKTTTVSGNTKDYDITQRRLDFLLKSYGDTKDYKCKIYLVHGDLTDGNMTWLYTHPKVKCLVSLAHGEGYGLPIFEAAYNGLPVIAPAWSGHMDFMMAPKKDKKTKKIRMRPHFAKVDYELGNVQSNAVWEPVILPDSKWCFPKAFSYKKQLRQVYKDHGFHKSQAKKLMSHIQENYTPESQYKKFVEAFLGEAVQEKVVVATEDLPKISVITSVYNGDEFIEPFLQDITRQTIFKEKCELILINANSPGNEEEVIKKYVEKYPDNIVYKKLDDDPGIYSVWNMGVEMATGEYLTNANLDDRKSPLFLEVLAKQLFANEDVDVVYTENLLTFAANETFENNSSNGQVYPSEEFSLEGMLRGNSPHCMPMWRASLHKDNGTFDETYKSASDWEFWLRCAFNDSVFMKVNKPLGLYYYNPTGMSTNQENNSWKQKEEREIFKKYQKLFLKSQ
jgi:hypothetical protein